MQERSKIHVGLDVHKDSISVAAAEPDRAPGRSIDSSKGFMLILTLAMSTPSAIALHAQLGVVIDDPLDGDNDFHINPQEIFQQPS
jgi:hypothetical protein